MTRPRPLTACLWAGYLFLYAPIALVVLYSFNSSTLVTVWGGWSLRWYGRLLSDRAILDAAWLSLRVAAVSASLAVVLGTMAGVALARHGRFRGRGLLSGLVVAPMVMPEVIIGLASLLLFVSLGVGRGFWTIVIAHVSFTTSVVSVVVRARLAGFDRSLEEAAQDLGAAPLRVFLDVTLPLIAPAVVAGWLLAFTLSVDQLVISSFVSGPQATTLPMIVYSKVRLGLTPDVNALATLIVAAVGAVTLCAGVVAGRGGRRPARPLAVPPDPGRG